LKGADRLNRLKIRAFYRWRIKIIQVVDDRNLPLALTDQVFRKMRANKTGTAGDQNVLCHKGILGIRLSRSKLENITSLLPVAKP
jgi:hypothetical protein